MQMIWLMGATAPAKKVHFNLNGCELRGFPIKARFGQSSVLYANPLAPKAVACFYLCPAVITTSQRAHSRCLSKQLIRIFCTTSPSLLYEHHIQTNSKAQPRSHFTTSHHFLENVNSLLQKSWNSCDRNMSAGVPNNSKPVQWRTCQSCWQSLLFLIKGHNAG